MVTAVGTALGDMISWVGSVVTALVGNTGALKDLLPLFCIGLAASVLMFAMKAIRKITWGA